MGSDQSVMLRAGRLRGEQWNYARNPYLSGVIESTRLDVSALGLVPLRLEEQGIWDPSEHYWGEKDEPIEELAKPIITRGPRPEFEMGQVLPGANSDDPFSDPITESNDRRDSGDSEGAYKILMDLCQSDLRCRMRLGRFEEAARIFDRMLWLYPSDNQGVRGVIDDVRAQVAWEKSRYR